MIKKINTYTYSFTFLIVNIKHSEITTSEIIGYIFTFLIVNIKLSDIFKIFAALFKFTFLIVNIKRMDLKVTKIYLMNLHSS